MHPALRKGPLFLQNTTIFHFCTKTPPPPFHFLPAGLQVPILSSPENSMELNADVLLRNCLPTLQRCDVVLPPNVFVGRAVSQSVRLSRKFV